MRLHQLLAILVLGTAAISARAAAPATAAGTAHATPQAATSPTQAQAQEDISLPPSAAPPFAQVDTDHDGTIDWKEAQAAGVPKKIFDHDDFDGNGKLNETEWLFVRLDMTDFTPRTKAPAAATH